ncbi:hypothetical protein YC2023_076765 [Brassica napus]
MKMGPEIMNQLAEGYESICERALPSTAHDTLEIILKGSHELSTNKYKYVTLVFQTSQQK